MAQQVSEDVRKCLEATTPKEFQYISKVEQNTKLFHKNCQDLGFDVAVKKMIFRMSLVDIDNILAVLDHQNKTFNSTDKRCNRTAELLMDTEAITTKMREILDELQFFQHRVMKKVWDEKLKQAGDQGEIYNLGVLKRDITHYRDTIENGIKRGKLMKEIYAELFGDDEADQFFEDGPADSMLAEMCKNKFSF